MSQSPENPGYADTPKSSTKSVYDMEEDPDIKSISRLLSLADDDTYAPGNENVDENQDEEEK